MNDDDGRDPRNAVAVLVATDDGTDAELVRKLLGDQFGRIELSTQADQAVADFDQHQPNVLVLAFHDLQRSEQHYLLLLRRSAACREQPHRTIVLCDKQDVQSAYGMCRKQVFDDYVLFWPVGNDAPRLPMAVFHALRELDSASRAGPQADQFASPARLLGELPQLFERGMSQGQEHMASADRAIEHAEHDIRAALDAFMQRLGSHGQAIDAAVLGQLRGEIDRLRDHDVRQRMQSISETMQPLKSWASEFGDACAPHLDAAGTAGALVRNVRPLLLVVDDDPVLRRSLATVLDSAEYRVTSAGSGIEAIRVLRRICPELILLDVVMPGMDGLTVLRALKANPAYARIPVVMVTGKREQGIVLRCLQAGAADFVVKPFERGRLLERVRLALERRAGAEPATAETAETSGTP